MRRKLLALNLAIVMILMLLPIKALAVNTTLTAGQQTVISSNELHYKSQTFYYTPQESGTYDFVFSGITTFGDLILYDGSNALKKVTIRSYNPGFYTEEGASKPVKVEYEDLAAIKSPSKVTISADLIAGKTYSYYIKIDTVSDQYTLEVNKRAESSDEQKPALTNGQQTVISSSELRHKSKTIYYTPQETGSYDFVFSGFVTYGDLMLYDGSNALKKVAIRSYNAGFYTEEGASKPVKVEYEDLAAKKSPSKVTISADLIAGKTYSYYIKINTVSDPYSLAINKTNQHSGNNSARGSLDNFVNVNTYNPNKFTDVPSSEWYAQNVASAYERGLMKGISNTKFNPIGNVSIAETVTLACRLRSIYFADGREFIQGSPWYQVYLDYAFEKGILSSAFSNYDKAATRAEFVSILSKAFPNEALKAINTVADNAIPDYKINNTYSDEVYRFYRAGILTGSDSVGSFLPNSSISRAEVSAIITRMMIENQRMRFSHLAEVPVGKWVYGGYEAELPHREYEILTVNGVKTDEVRYTGTYKDYGTKFRLLHQSPNIYFDYGYLGMNLHFANRSDKVIKYLTVYVTPYNRVNDALAATQAVDFTGPFYKPTMNTDWSSDYYYWYDGYYVDQRITDGGKYYKDGSYQKLTEQQISGVYQLYHSDDLWYDYYEQTNYLWISAVKIIYTDGTSAYYSGNNLKACVW